MYENQKEASICYKSQENKDIHFACKSKLEKEVINRECSKNTLIKEKIMKRNEAEDEQLSNDEFSCLKKKNSYYRST